MEPTSPDDLVLYGYPSCPYCAKVRRVADRLGVELQHRNIRTDPEALRELREAMAGRQTVPVLRIGPESGPHRWMPESSVIARYLGERFGDGTTSIGLLDPSSLLRTAVIALASAWLAFELFSRMTTSG